MKKQKGISFIELNVSIVLFLIVALCIISALANCTLWAKRTTELRQTIHLAQWKMAETQYMSESQIQEVTTPIVFPSPFNNYKYTIQKLTPADPRLEGFTEIKVTAIGITGAKTSLVILKSAPAIPGNILVWGYSPGVGVWTIDSNGQTVSNLPIYNDGISSMRVSPDKNKIVFYDTAGVGTGGAYLFKNGQTYKLIAGAPSAQNSDVPRNGCSWLNNNECVVQIYNKIYKIDTSSITPSNPQANPEEIATGRKIGVVTPANKFFYQGTDDKLYLYDNDTGIPTQIFEDIPIRNYQGHDVLSSGNYISTPNMEIPIKAGFTPDGSKAILVTLEETKLPWTGSPPYSKTIMRIRTANSSNNYSNSVIPDGKEFDVAPITLYCTGGDFTFTQWVSGITWNSAENKLVIGICDNWEYVNREHKVYVLNPNNNNLEELGSFTVKSNKWFSAFSFNSQGNKLLYSLTLGISEDGFVNNLDYDGSDLNNDREIIKKTGITGAEWLK